MTASGDSGSARLSAQDWVQAGFRVLAQDGVRGLTIDRLCRRLGVTKGSFYWHFTNMNAYRHTLIDAWAAIRDEDREDFDTLDRLPPRQRLSRMMTSLVGPRHWLLERAMREWTRSDDAVAAAVRHSDHRVVLAVRRAFLDHGFDPDGAALRADATFAAGIGFLHLAGARPGTHAAARREQFLDLLLQR